jgi:hypothetical protein
LEILLAAREKIPTFAQRTKNHSLTLTSTARNRGQALLYNPVRAADFTKYLKKKWKTKFWR